MEKQFTGMEEALHFLENFQNKSPNNPKPVN